MFSPSHSPPPFPTAPGSGSYPRVLNPTAAASRTEAGAWAGHLGRGRGSPHIGSALRTLHVHFCLLEEKGGSQQCSGLSIHPAPSHQLCPPRSASQCRSMPSLPYCHFLVVENGQGQELTAMTWLLSPAPHCQSQGTLLGLPCQPAFPSNSCTRARMFLGVHP